MRNLLKYNLFLNTNVIHVLSTCDSYNLSFVYSADLLKRGMFIVFKFLKNLSIFNYKSLLDIAVIDNVNLNRHVGTALLFRFSIYYLLLSQRNSSKMRLSIIQNINLNDYLISISDIYLSADWSERECWDMFGIFFVEHLDLRRILTDYGFCGWPLRKDFPVTGYYIVYYNEEIESIAYNIADLSQENRIFQFENPWGHKENKRSIANDAFNTNTNTNAGTL